MTPSIKSSTLLRFLENSLFSITASKFRAKPERDSKHFHSIHSSVHVTGNLMIPLLVGFLTWIHDSILQSRNAVRSLALGSLNFKFLSQHKQRRRYLGRHLLILVCHRVKSKHRLQSRTANTNLIANVISMNFTIQGKLPCSPYIRRPPVRYNFQCPQSDGYAGNNVTRPYLIAPQR